MQLEIVVTNAGGKVVEMARTFAAFSKTATVHLFDVEPGCEIKAVAKDDKGRFLGTFYAENAFRTQNVTAAWIEDGIVAVTDDASNTYTRE